MNTLLTDYLAALGVPHTAPYSDKAYRAMPFQSCFGLKKLLERYCIDSVGLILGDKSEIAKLPTPFLAQMRKGFVIVTEVSPETVVYTSQGISESVPTADFTAAWNGMAFVARPEANACEPEYHHHALMLNLERAKRVVLTLAAIFLAGYFFITRGLYEHPSLILVALFDCAGLFFTYLLVQKSLNIKSKTGDKVCGVLQQGGCDSVLKTKASSFFGLFGWSEVGFAYFSVSLAALLLFPSAVPYLALCNVCCLPFSFWSIWYQKTQAKAWCTLCVSVQATLWALFFCYLGGGWFSGIFPLQPVLFALGAAYVAALLGLNRLMPLIEKPEFNDDETDLLS